MATLTKDTKKRIRKTRRAKFALRVNTGTALLLAAFLFGMLNYLSFRHYHRQDLSRSHYYSLSDKTRNLLSQLDAPIRVFVFFQRDERIFEDVQNLLKEYTYACENLRVEYIDPDRDVARMEELAVKYKVTEANVVIFDSGTRNHYVSADDIYEMKYDIPGMVGKPTRLSFRGEQAFSSAIHSITQAEAPTVYLLHGHGEGDPENFDERAGFSELSRVIKMDNLELRTLNLADTRQVPEDCDALIILGPTARISQPEIDLLSTYLDNNGRALILLDAMRDSGLEPLLDGWGVKLSKDLVVDAARTLTGLEIFVTQYGEHKITERLKGISSVFYMPRSVMIVGEANESGTAADRPKVIPLASTSESGWAESNLNENPMRYDPGADLPGPVHIAAAIERGPVPGINMEIQLTRMVVFGDSGFVSNSGLTGGDIDLFMSSLNWLLDREELLGISPKNIEVSQLSLSEKQLNLLLIIAAGGLPGVVLLLGGIVWAARRR